MSLLFDQLILHIGRHKSGTSSLQHWLSNNERQLFDQGFLYPKAGRRGVAHHNLADQLNPKISTGSELSSMIDDIKMEKKTTGTLILSSEALQNISDLTRLKTLIDALNPSHIKVVCFVREFLDYSISAYRQFLQNQTRYMPFSKYTERFQDMRPFLQRWRDIGDLYLAWMYHYDGSTKNIIQEFCTHVGIKASSYSSKNMNPSIGGNLLATKLLCNKLGITGLEYKALGELALKEERFQSPFYIPDNVACTAQQNSPYNLSLISELGEVKFKSWANYPSIPQIRNAELDMAVTADSLNIEFPNGFLRELETLEQDFQIS